MFIEKHTYAPELNKVFLHGVAIAAPGVTSIGEARHKLFKPQVTLIVATVTKTYPGHWAHLNRVYSGVVDTREKALQFARGIREKEKGGILNNGDILPAPTITVKTKLKG